MTPGSRPWRRVTARHPCRVCGKGDWCCLSTDGRLAACRRVETGCYRSKADKAGTPVYLHRVEGGAPTAADKTPPAANGAALDRADPDVLHRVYSALLAALTLSPAHRADLHARGLNDDDIDRRHYRSLPGQGRARLVRSLREQFGEVMQRVPGIVTRERGGERYLTLAGAAGLLVPVRESAGRVVALLVRSDGDAPPKYSWVSSTKYGGPGPGAPVHVPFGVTGAGEVLRVTEGPLKADIAHALSGVPTLGLPGVTTWRPALAVVRQLGARTVRMAIDADASDKASVGGALARFAEALDAEAIGVELERWPAPHKGIDDALAARVTVEVLAGDAARQAIGETLAEATAGEPPAEPSAIDRLADVLAEGAPALYRDAQLLQALARLGEEHPAEFACVRARLRGAGIKLHDFDKALAPLRQELRRQRPAADAAGCYRVAGGRIVREVQTANGAVEVPLANWAGRIVEETVLDDGAERRLTLAIEGAIADGTPLPRADVPAERFPLMRWPVEVWGSRAVVLAGASTADHLRAALQLLSGDVPRRVVYGHTGWRESDGHWYYLHAGGAISGGGPAEGIEVALPEALRGVQLAPPPSGAELVEAVRASLRILDLAPDRITVPLLAAVYRAPLGAADFGLHLAGSTGTGKSELAALAQQHYGAALDARHLPGSWSSTGNSLEALAFAAKDALLVVDDFAPCGATGDVQRMHREADRLLRAQGNRSGRARCRTDGSVRPPKPPSGLIVSTGEDVPRGQSLRGRLLVSEIGPDDLKWTLLTTAQGDAAAGKYAAALTGYLHGLAPRYAKVRDGLRAEACRLREQVHADGLHARTPGIVAELAVGLRLFLAFAVEAGALTGAERDILDRRGWEALRAAGAAQAGPAEAAEPCGYFLRLLAGLLASGRAHVAGTAGAAPSNADAWGWRREEAQGRRIGWLDGADLYLEPEAAYAEAQELARLQGDSLPVTVRTLWGRMREKGYLVSWDESRQRNTVRRRLGGRERRDVIHLRAEALYADAPPSPPSPGLSQPHRNGDGAGDSPGPCECDRPRRRPHSGANDSQPDGTGDGGDGMGQGQRPSASSSIPAPERRRGTI
jgi:hypothetical protein